MDTACVLLFSEDSLYAFSLSPAALVIFRTGHVIPGVAGSGEEDEKKFSTLLISPLPFVAAFLSSLLDF